MLMPGMSKGATFELALPSGRAILVEAPVGGARDVSMLSKTSMTEFLASLEELSAVLLQAVKAAAPTEAEVELSVGVDGSTGKLTAFFVDGGVKGAMKVRLIWKPEATD